MSQIRYDVHGILAAYLSLANPLVEGIWSVPEIIFPDWIITSPKMLLI